MTHQIIVINKHELELTNLNKILFPKINITKQALIEYYQKIAPVMLPWLHNRALSLFRFPDGIDGQKFFQKNTPDYFPTWVKRLKVTLKTIDKFDLYSVCNNLETLIYLANYVCVPHVWLSKIDKLDWPDRLIFDLDPGQKEGFEQVKALALELNIFLSKLGLKPFVMLTGSTGMHVIVPIKRTKNFEEVRLFAKQVAQLFVKKNPDLYTLEMNVAKRQERVFIDILRNGFGATAVAPYAVRDKEGAPVATPINWQEVEESNLSSQRYNINNIFKKLEHEPQPWPNFDKAAVSLTEPIKKLAKIKNL
jgi:bifunctional non-homologous end joining protein LigD